MPLTPNGKIDRKALPEPEFTSDDYIAPESRTEKILCKVIADELGIGRIGITDNLQSIGMSSLNAMRIGMKLMRLDYPVNMGILLKYNNVKTLAKQIDEGRQTIDVGLWARPFDDSKQVIVVCCGFARARLYINNLNSWFEEFNIYLIQPLFNSWTDIDRISYTELLDRYIQLLQRDIPCHVSCFFGFSFGGELAYRLACLWDRRFHKRPAVLMGDTFLHVDDNDVLTQASEQVRVDTDNNVYEKIYEEEFNFFLQGDIFDHLGVLPAEKYQGNVTLISAIGDTSPRDDNEHFWSELKPDVNIVRINDTHGGIGMKAIYYPKYLEIIEKNIG